MRKTVRKGKYVTMTKLESETHMPSDCRAISQVLSRIGDKWSVLVVMTLSRGPLRFSQIQEKIGGISQKMLTTTLRSLERDDLVTRTVFPTIPPRVDYELTDLGRDLTHPVSTLAEWALRNQDRMNRSRTAFDARANGGDAEGDAKG